MDNNSTQSSSNNEIDLLKVSNSLKNGLTKSLKIIPNTINFIKRNILILVGLLIIGIVAGYFYNKYEKVFNSNIIVTPNFETVDYLYEKVTLLNSHIQQNDKDFLQKVGIDPSYKIDKVEVKPISDLYKFLNQEDKYFDIFNTLSENNDAKKVAEDFSTSKNFPKHLLTVSSKTKINQKVLDNIVKYINTSDHYQIVRVEILNNFEDKIVVNDSIIKQIDAILKNAGAAKNNSSIFFNEQSQLNDLIVQKNKAVEENHYLKVEKLNLKYIVAPLDFSKNIEDNTGLKGKYHLVFPLILIGLFIVIRLIKKVK
ncbi:hypothetical protein [Algoriella sp.]|uniref:hypothetical protein n=1 Tax=Algoriella sp. TaxID=1872434 RepID=UPI001AFD4569|nr:hypothetical protein [Algoriella sp.]MBO6213063.1 hypothetical protein [Algoriella sp.]